MVGSGALARGAGDVRGAASWPCAGVPMQAAQHAPLTANAQRALGVARRRRRQHTGRRMVGSCGSVGSIHLLGRTGSRCSLGVTRSARARTRSDRTRADASIASARQGLAGDLGGTAAGAGAQARPRRREAQGCRSADRRWCPIADAGAARVRCSPPALPQAWRRTPDHARRRRRLRAGAQGRATHRSRHVSRTAVRSLVR